jgi:hypothetical protein
MAKYTAYTQNADNSINVLAGSDRREVFPKILPEGTEYEIHEGEIYTAGGKTWLTPSEAYEEAKRQDEQNAAIAELNAEFAREKANLCEAYTSASMSGDTETAESIAADMADLNDWYDEKYAKIENGEVEDNG